MALLLGLWEFLKNQFETLPYPTEDCSGKTIIVTGANVGLGLEAARHFVRLDAAKVILGCRNLDKAAAAKQSIEESTRREGVVELWQLDLGSFESVKDFSARANQLDRLDIVVNNASRLAPSWETLEGHESQVTVNVISTLLLSVLMLRQLRHTAKRFNVTPHIVIVSSEGSFVARFPEGRAAHVLSALDTPGVILDRYNTTKLLQLMVTKKLAEAIDTSGQGRVVVNSLHPGLCRTQLFRRYPLPLSLLFKFTLLLIGREAEMGSRTLTAAAFAGEETHGKWMTNCRLNAWPAIMERDEGERLTTKFWNELLGVLEEIEPGVADKM